MTNTYAALITLTLPGMDGPTSATVVLHPQDAIPTTSGRIIPLTECTLADLQAFADLLEEQVWQDYQTIRLTELLNSDESAAAVTLLGETAELLTDPVNWEAYCLILDEATTDGRPLTAEEETTDGRPPAANGQEEIVDDEQLPASDEPPPAVDGRRSDDDVPVSVAETEPVRPEPEAEPDKEPAPLPPGIRVAGKRRPLGHPTWTAVDILINEPAFRAAQTHALSSMSREVAGVLVGPPPEKQPDGRYLVHITDTIIAKHTRMHGASVTYTPESWRYLNDKLAELYPDETAVMVGWYHTHPGFGIFLSGMDQFIHQNFFTQIWHVALVLDPVARRSGFFCWDRAKQDVRAYEFPWPLWAAGTW
jgi:proteasome lid subunit RPN8/RPN11